MIKSTGMFTYIQLHHETEMKVSQITNRHNTAEDTLYVRYMHIHIHVFMLKFLSLMIFIRREPKRKRYMYIKLNSNLSSMSMHPQAYFEIHHFSQKINQLYSYLNILILYDNLLQSCECIKTKK